MNGLLRSPLARAVVVALILSAALGWMVWQRLSILNNGREIVLRTAPVDPRDLFRGHYVRLNYDISRIPTGRVDGLKGISCRERQPLRGRAILVALMPGEDGFWHFAGATLRGMAAMRNGIAPRGAVVIAGWLRNNYCDALIRVRYGLERYYAPRHRAQELERLVFRRGEAGAQERRQPLGVIVRVDPDTGKAAIAGLMINGRRIYEDPLF